MENFKAFLKKKDIEISAKRYGIDALGAMAQGLFASLLIGTIIATIGVSAIPTITETIIPMKNGWSSGAAVSSGMGTCGLVGQIGVYTGWAADVASGAKSAITAFDWIGLLLICFILPGLLTWLFGLFFRKIGWIKENDLKLDL